MARRYRSWHRQAALRALLVGFGLSSASPLGACQRAAIPSEWTLEAEEIRTLGGESDGDATAFLTPVALEFDAQGRIYVLEGGGDRVRVFSPRGEPIVSIGRHGKGRGEVSGPEGLWVYPNGELMIADTGNRRLVRFGAAWEPLDEIRLDYLPLEVVGTAERIFVLRLPPASFVFGPQVEPLVSVLDRDGRHLDTVVMPQPNNSGILYFLLNARRMTLAPGGGFALAHTHAIAQVQIYDRLGSPAGTIDTLYKAASWAPLGTLPHHLGERSLDRVARTISDIVWDETRGLYWVVAGYVDRTAESTWTIGTELYRYDISGAYRGSVMLPYSARLAAAAPDRTMWTIDDTGILHQFRLRDPDLAPPGAVRR